MSEPSDPPRLLRVTCPPTLGPYVEEEVRSLGFDPESADRTGVEIRGTMSDAMMLNLRLRTALHVLQRFADVRARDAEAMYQGAVRLPWERVIASDGYVSVTSTVSNDTITNSMFPNVRLKDAIVDRINSVAGRRPDSGPRSDRAVVHMYWNDDRCRIYLDTSGRKLSDRGYRRIPTRAPMRESLAAAVLMETGYDASQPLVIPMCGSGTIAIEAALIATGRVPGLLRGNFGFMHLLTFDETAWGQARLAAKKLRHARPCPPIIATDIDQEAVEASRRNAITAGVEHLIDFRVCDFADTPLPDQPGIILLHGEYGQRLGGDELAGTYRRMGDFFKQSCPGWGGFVFTSRDWATSVGLRASRRVPFMNADIDCRLLRYELYEGKGVS
ncbi:MAG: hypothetical protein QGH76_04160 [Phycisphaerales bacterium]|nr:hypothetical protein [Phycisphaerales bacterium]